MSRIIAFSDETDGSEKNLKSLIINASFHGSGRREDEMENPP